MYTLHCPGHLTASVVRFEVKHVGNALGDPNQTRRVLDKGLYSGVIVVGDG